VSVEEDVNGTVSINAYKGLSGKIHIGGALLGTLNVTQGTQPNVTGSIKIGRLSGNIHIGGDLGDPNEPTDPNDPNMPGHICIDGAFVPDSPECNAPTILIDGNRVGNRSFVAVNYTGWTLLDPNDPNVVVWDPNATVTICHYGAQNCDVYRGNAPDEHIWLISKCRGDLNNNEYLDFGDIDGLVLALQDPSGQHYAVAYPGLGGSLAFHGNNNCDGSINFGDIAAFVTRLQNFCCLPDCDPNLCLPPESEESGRSNGPEGGASAPEMLAMQLALNVAPELFDTLVDLAAQCAAGLPDEDQRAYWQAVYEALVE
jgi:hypothetical protein